MTAICKHCRETIEWSSHQIKYWRTTRGGYASAVCNKHPGFQGKGYANYQNSPHEPMAADLPDLQSVNSIDGWLRRELRS